ncbi:MAG: hypothetical protein GKS00_26470 [Alphaproteobacteria bacterium]|nr:hypothetical protein [Alphaproteobacteria bacterium]
MRPFVTLLFLLSGCDAVDAVENARTPSEAIYLLRQSEDEKRVNPYDNDPRYRAVYCSVDGVEFRSTVNACSKANGEARLTNQ